LPVYTLALLGVARSARRSRSLWPSLISSSLWRSRALLADYPQLVSCYAFTQWPMACVVEARAVAWLLVPAMKLWQRRPVGAESFEALRLRLFANTLLLMALMTLPALLIILMRYRLLGWQPFLALQLFAVICLWSLVLLRERLSLGARMFCLGALFFMFVTPSTIQLGPAAESRGFLLFIIFLSGLFIGPRAGLLTAALAMLWVVLLGSFAILHGLPLSISDYPAYTANPSVWLSMMIVLGLFGGVTGYIGSVLIAHLKNQHQALQSSEGRLRGLFELSPIGISLSDVASGRVLHANQALLANTGYSLAEYLALPAAALTPAEFALQEQAQLQQLLASGRAGPYEKELLRKDGSRCAVRLEGMLLVDALAQQQAWWMITDITEERRLATLQREFVSTVSHELRTPLTSIAGALGLVSAGVLGELPEAARAMLNIARENSQQLTFLVNDLLDMEKLQAGKMSFTLQPQPLRALVETAVRNNQSYAEQYQVSFHLVGTQDAQVEVDAPRLEQVLNNLLSNAAKFSPPHAQIELAIAARGEQVRVSVRDQGPGIAEAFRG
jgi:PAS domain S-box-containing protein